jgi:hypothetical protein
VVVDLVHRLAMFLFGWAQGEIIVSTAPVTGNSVTVGFAVDWPLPRPMSIAL